MGLLRQSALRGAPCRDRIGRDSTVSFAARMFAALLLHLLVSLAQAFVSIHV